MIINGETKVYGIFGYPVKHSKSPLFQTEAFKHCEINAVYVPFEVKPENIQKAVESVKALNIQGINITVPHKESVIPYLNELSEEVKIIKAVNTIKNVDGYLIGYNTDWYGFIEGLKEIFPNISGKRVLVIGAGGSTRAVIYGLLNEGVGKVYIANRTINKAQQIIEDFSEVYRIAKMILKSISLKDIENIIDEVDLIVNTTSVGLVEDDLPIFNYDILKQKHTVVDIIYKETPLLKKAKEKNLKYQNGYPMLIYQGAKSFEIWTGQKAPINVIKKVLGIEK